MMPSVLAPATGRLELSTEMEETVGGEGLGEVHQFSFGRAESLAFTWYLNKVSPLDEVIKGGAQIEKRRGSWTLLGDPPASRG